MPDVASAAAELAGHGGGASVFGRLTADDALTLRRALIDSAAKTSIGIGGIGALALGREKLRQRELNKHEQEMAEAYDAMIKKTPSLAKHDPDKVKDYFSVLAEKAPSYAKHPHAAGSWVDSQIQYGTLPHQAVSDLISTQKNYEATTKGRLDTSTIRAIVTGNGLTPSIKV